MTLRHQVFLILLFRLAGRFSKASKITLTVIPHLPLILIINLLFI